MKQTDRYCGGGDGVEQRGATMGMGVKFQVRNFKKSSTQIPFAYYMYFFNFGICKSNFSSQKTIW